MALNSYGVFEGASQGLFKSENDQAGHEGEQEIWGWSHEVISPRDAASGLPTGKRQHKPLVLTMPIGPDTPLMYNALVNNEELTKVLVKCWRPSPKDAAEQHHYTVELMNANIAGIRVEQLNNKYPENMNHPVRKHVSCTYQKITWTWELGGQSAYDDWKASVQA